MNPLILIAASVLPEILKLVTSPAGGGDAGELSKAVVKAVTDAAGTADPNQAKQKIATDPAASDALKIKLAELAAQQEQAKREADLSSIKASLDAEAQKRADDLQRLREEFASEKAARDSLLDFEKACGIGPCTGPVVSLIVAIGFFVITLLVLFSPSKLPDTTAPAWQIINMIVGALITAFATVVNFWLGSSQGSRAKDVTNARIAQQNADNVKQANETTNAVLRNQSAAAAPKSAAKSPNFSRCFELVLKQEGGFVDNPADPGGATNMGITKATLEHFRGEAVTVDDVRNLKKEEAGQIYQARYWNALNCDALPAGLDLIVFDFGVNSGPTRAARLLQATAGAKDDGAIGPSTLGAIKANDVAEIIKLYSQRRLEFLQNLPTFGEFGRGWTRRVTEIRDAALAMAAASSRPLS
jgi:hypothetical protein